MDQFANSTLVTLGPGAVGGFFNVVVGHPIDCVKVKLQTASSGLSMGTVFRQIASSQGGFYMGVSAPLVAVIPAFALVFGSYEFSKRQIYGTASSKELRLDQIAICGSITGLCLGMVLGPLERIKCLMQVRGTGTFQSTFAECYRAGGIRSVFRGTALCIARDVPGNAAYFGTYEGVQRATPNNAAMTLLAGGLAGVGNWIVAIPFDVIKSRWQTNDSYKSVFSCAKQLVEKEGASSLFKGIAPALLRAFPANAATLLGVETARSGLEYFGIRVVNTR